MRDFHLIILNYINWKFGAALINIIFKLKTWPKIVHNPSTIVCGYEYPKVAGPRAVSMNLFQKMLIQKPKKKMPQFHHDVHLNFNGLVVSTNRIACVW